MVLSVFGVLSALQAPLSEAQLWALCHGVCEALLEAMRTNGRLPLPEPPLAFLTTQTVTLGAEGRIGINPGLVGKRGGGKDGRKRGIGMRDMLSFFRFIPYCSVVFSVHSLNLQVKVTLSTAYAFSLRKSRKNGRFSNLRRSVSLTFFLGRLSMPILGL